MREGGGEGEEEILKRSEGERTCTHEGEWCRRRGRKKGRKGGGKWGGCECIDMSI